MKYILNNNGQSFYKLRFNELLIKSNVSFLVLDFEEFGFFNKFVKLVSNLNCKFITSNYYSKFYLSNNLKFWGGNIIFLFLFDLNLYEQLKFILNNYDKFISMNIIILGYIYNGFFLNFDK